MFAEGLQLVFTTIMVLFWGLVAGFFAIYVVVKAIDAIRAKIKPTKATSWEDTQ